MGFFKDLGAGIGNIIKAPFEGAATLAAGIGQGVGSIIHGSGRQQYQPQQYAQQCAQGYQGQDPGRAMAFLAFQNALMMNMVLAQRSYPRAMCCG